MRVVSVNVGNIQAYPWRGETASAIAKQPCQLPVEVAKQGLVGDQQADKINHGGEDKAVMVIPESNYALHGVAEQPFGFLGENLTLAGLDESDVQVGDQLQIDSVLLEVSQPRSPCWKLGQINGDQRFVKHYSLSGRVGFYCRVLKGGEISPGLGVSVHKTGSGADIQRLFLAKFHHQSLDDWQLLAEAVTLKALSQSWREEISRLLANQLP
ncbi:MAG: MOSC domain-containing protein [Piscirickettsiaceae bacterium CG_4_9_14_3_um_filter_43_564]|nr:MOSC domain-containing protein [Thiomicrospira sp.]PIQ02936.1 MAG: MOSC domain-containing protein [Piscirickettsiaceae bacterium CG18_big_fil_WC_8_21_14_2_50_44_103]PIU38967.1 MAG: MOSC domain-containing protein [Piscirickettsiaceae bacterium CG07_land_8_20_14_0_80_44_28]PIW57488.1 MAG: MOSC domain-containing protein [Piscirickettsiaceae bacterium CG12_big_fil_rev_8_21_14_0_65_44_934]PIW78289.1 MAG: MOSC domain-containing protein [Piscirickettsiaceae bacterium CG_4_8_14_3_um_filter_44_38]PI